MDNDRVKKVEFFENGMIAIVEVVSPELGNRIQQVRLQLLGLIQELLQKFREKNIDFATHNAQEDSGSVLLNLIKNLAFPLILIGGIFSYLGDIQEEWEALEVMGFLYNLVKIPYGTEYWSDV